MNHKRAILKNPDVPVLTTTMIEALHKICFVPSGAKDQTVDALMIFGTGHRYREMGDYIATLIPTLTRHHRIIVITGGMPQFEDSAQIRTSEAQLIADYVTEKYPDIVAGFDIRLESSATNTTENITYSLPLFADLPAGSTIAYVAKEYASGRTLYGLLQHMSDMIFVSYSTNYDA